MNYKEERKELGRGVSARNSAPRAGGKLRRSNRRVSGGLEGAETGSEWEDLTPAYCPHLISSSTSHSILKPWFLKRPCSP